MGTARPFPCQVKTVGLKLKQEQETVGLKLKQEQELSPPCRSLVPDNQDKNEFVLFLNCDEDLCPAKLFQAVSRKVLLLQS